MNFTKATKTQAKLRFTFDGPAGSGKTYSSLLLAKQLGGKTAVIDTEHGSASKYANLFDFDTVALEEFSLETYLRAIAAARVRGYQVLVIDSLSHAWAGKGGALEQVDRVGGNNKFSNGWRSVTPLHNQLIDAMLAFPGHVIATMRTKMEYVVEQVNGKSVPRKVGMAPVQREGMEYEFDVIADLDLTGNLTIAKTRCPDISGNAGLLKLSDVGTLGDKLKAWLADGVAPAAPAPAPPAPSAPAGQLALAPGAANEDDWSTDGSPKSPLALVEVALTEAQSKADIDKVVPRIKKLSKGEQEQVRPLFKRRLEEVARAAAQR